MFACRICCGTCIYKHSDTHTHTHTHTLRAKEADEHTAVVSLSVSQLVYAGRRVDSGGFVTGWGLRRMGSGWTGWGLWFLGLLLAPFGCLVLPLGRDQVEGLVWVSHSLFFIFSLTALQALDRGLFLPLSFPSLLTSIVVLLGRMGLGWVVGW